MILGFKKRFEDGEPTNFKEKILAGEKIHSMREGYRWKAGYYIHMAYGVRTKDYVQFNWNINELTECKSTQNVFMTFLDKQLEITVQGKDLSKDEIELLIKNDGLTREQFIKWFFPKKAEIWSGQIIHWTNFKY